MSARWWKAKGAMVMGSGREAERLEGLVAGVLSVANGLAESGAVLDAAREWGGAGDFAGELVRRGVLSGVQAEIVATLSEAVLMVSDRDVRRALGPHLNCRRVWPLIQGLPELSGIFPNVGEEGDTVGDGGVGLWGGWVWVWGLLAALNLGALGFLGTRVLSGGMEVVEGGEGAGVAVDGESGRRGVGGSFWGAREWLEVADLGLGALDLASGRGFSRTEGEVGGDSTSTVGVWWSLLRAKSALDAVGPEEAERELDEGRRVWEDRTGERLVLTRDGGFLAWGVVAERLRSEAARAGGRLEDARGALARSSALRGRLAEGLESGGD